MQLVAIEIIWRLDGSVLKKWTGSRPIKKNAEKSPSRKRACLIFQYAEGMDG